jgi:hypothetical protein
LIFFWQVFVHHGHASAATQENDLDPIIVRRLPYGSAGQGAVAAVLTQEEIRNLPVRTPQDLLDYVGVDIQGRGARGIKETSP